MTAKYSKHVNPFISAGMPDNTRKFYLLRVICYYLNCVQHLRLCNIRLCEFVLFEYDVLYAFEC